MNRSLAIIFLTFSVVFSSCSFSHDGTQHFSPDPFREFLKKFRPLKLPLTFRRKIGAENFDYSRPSQDTPTIEELKDLPKYDENSADTLFIKEGPGTIYYGLLPDTSNYLGLVVILGGVESEPVVLKTYNKSGKLISETQLDCGSCGALIDLEWCSRTAIIKKDLTIYNTDTIKTARRDSTLKAIDGTGEYYFVSDDRKINSDGQIIMTAHQKANISGN